VAAAAPVLPEPLQPKGHRSHEPTPFEGLTHKPYGALCAQETGARSYWNPGSYETSSSMSAPNNALPRFRTLCTNSKNPR
jgi:hypothetical protein